MGKNKRHKEDVSDEREIVDGDLLEVSSKEDPHSFDVEALGVRTNENAVLVSNAEDQKSLTITKASKAWAQYIAVPLIFLFVTLLGGLRIGAETGEFLFLKPALICLIFAVMLLVMFFRARLVKLEDWFSEDRAPLENAANACVLLTLFAASTQVFNSLLPEQGLPFWIIGFFFLWSLWTNLFAPFNPKKLLTSLGSLFGLAFITKYLILANLTAPDGGGFIQAFFLGNLTKETITYLLDLPHFAAATGYIQFFALAFYLIGLFLLSPSADADRR